MSKAIRCIIGISMLLQASRLSALSETALYQSIVDCSMKHDAVGLDSRSDRFMKNFPRSMYVPHIKLILAESEAIPGNAIDKLNNLIKDYPAFEKNSYALFQICQIRQLTSDWKGLWTDSLSGIRVYKQSPHIAQFRLFYIQAGINLERYDDADEECSYMISSIHDYDTLSRALLYRAIISKCKSGFSREYARILRELLLGFQDSGIYPSVLYMTGNFYEKKEDYARAYSAYCALIKKFPGSVEGIHAKKRIDALSSHPLKITDFIPDDETINRMANLDITPEKDLNSNMSDTPILFSVSVGPFSTVKSMVGIKKIMATYGETKTLRLKYGYMIFVGRLENSDDAVNLKIRLAEEYGINGRVVRININDSKKYIYGE